MNRRLVILLLAVTALLTVIEPRVTANNCSGSGDQAGPYCIEGIIPDPEAATFISTLTSAINNATTTIPVASVTGFTVGDHILIDQEKMLITAKGTTSLTVTRAQLDSSKAAHALGATVIDLKPINNDIAGSTKELGPVNGASTKLNVIHNCVPPGCLEDTNPNAQVDLNTVWLKGDTGSGPGGTDDLWLYYAWSRDSNSGSGFLSLELQHNAAPAECDYVNASAADLKAECNPFANRTDGDLMLLWDQQGNSRDVYVRIFENGAFGSPILLTDLDPTSEFVGAAFAQYGNGGFRGEMAVDLSVIIPDSGQDCDSFANVIPGTVTGNSDTADYKDVVLKKFPLISNCGGLKIIKNTSPDGGTGTFHYLVSGVTGMFPGDVDAACTDDTNHDQCAGTLVNDDDFDELEGILNSGSYTLSEGTIPSDYQLTSISCVLGQNTYDVYPGVDPNNPNKTFPVQTGQQTVCTITNTLKTGTYRVVKEITSGFGISATCPQFQFKVDSGNFQAWDSTCQTDFTFAVGTQHSAVEDLTSLPLGFVYDSSTANCTNGVIVADSVITCTIKNKATPASPLLGTAQNIVLHDRAKITGIRRGSDDDIGGTNQASVTFSLFAGEGCVAANQVGSSQTVFIDFADASTTQALAGTSTGFAIAFNGAGASNTPRTWSWKAVYNGNAFNNATPSDATACNEAIIVTISGNTQIQ